MRSEDKDNPRKFSPLPWQVAPWKDTRPTMVLAGGAGSGKSVFALHKLNALCLRFPGALALLVRKSRTSLRNSAIPMLESIVPGHVTHLKTDSRFIYPNGSRIVYGGMYDEKQRQAIRSIAGENGSGVDFALMEEASAFTAQDLDEVSGRMRGSSAPFRQIILCTNPDTETHWINQQFIKPHLAGILDTSKAAVYLPGPLDNPILKPDYLDRLRGLSGVLRARLWEGRWVRAEGTVYDEFDPDVHLIEPFEIPADWRRYRAIDMGYNHARVCLWGALDWDDNLYIYRETYRTQQTASHHAIQLRRLSNNDGKGESYEATWADHDAGERADYEEGGISTIPANKDVKRGLQAVRWRLQNALNAKNGQNTGPWVKFFRGCTFQVDEKLRESHKPYSTVQEFDCYLWKRNGDGSVSTEEPIKENDHGMDALRYMIMGIDKDRSSYDISADQIQREMEYARSMFGRTQRRPWA